MAIADKNISEKVIGYSSLQTTSKNKTLFTRRDILQTDKAQKYQELLAWPSTSVYKDILEGNEVINCDVTTDDIQRGIFVYGEPVPLLKAKMKRISPRTRPVLTKVPLPLSISELYRDLILYMDIMWVNGDPFLLTKSGKINLYALPFLNQGVRVIY